MKKSEIKIKNRLKDWEIAKKKRDTLTGHRLTGEPFKGHDVFEMGLIMAEEQRAWHYYELAEAEAYPDTYPPEKIKFIEAEIDRLSRRIRAFKARQWPSRTRE